uniref:Uncharacterized protein n=1 Tax=Pan troglodytes TaxID=9598 RepID=A0A2I3SR57_PANTR
MMPIEELKVCLLGDTGVGKSSIVYRFAQDHFDRNISPTIEVSFVTKTAPSGNDLHKFLIWDTAGQERFHSLAHMLPKQDSFHTLKKWDKELKEHGPENICHLSDIREFPLKDAEEYAESVGAIMVETRAKNISSLDPHKNGNSGAMKLGKQTMQASHRCC